MFNIKNNGLTSPEFIRQIENLQLKHTYETRKGIRLDFHLEKKPKVKSC